MEQRVSCKHGLVVAILQEPADAVLRVAWRVETLHRDVSKLPHLAVSRRLGDALAVLSANDGEFRNAQLAPLRTSS